MSFTLSCEPAAKFSLYNEKLGLTCALSAVLTTEATDLQSNGLIRALPEATRVRWSPDLEAVEMPVGMVVSKAGRASSHVYFPTTAIVSLLNAVESNASTEVAVVGNEGMIGIALLMGGGSKSTGAVINTAGMAFRMDAEVFCKEFASSTVILHLLLRFTQALITQIAQTAVCNRHHALGQQVSRLLLLILDRSRDSNLVVTHDMIARMLGVRRESVTEAAQKLQRDGLIRYSRGHLLVLDRPGLEKASCDCYRVVKQEYDRLLPQPLGAG